MNRKEFEDKLKYLLDKHYGDYDEDLINDLWHRFEQQRKEAVEQAKIDENEHWINSALAQGALKIGLIDIRNRITKLKE